MRVTSKYLHERILRSFTHLEKPSMYNENAHGKSLPIFLFTSAIAKLCRLDCMFKGRSLDSMDNGDEDDW